MDLIGYCVVSVPSGSSDGWMVMMRTLPNLPANWGDRSPFVLVTAAYDEVVGWMLAIVDADHQAAIVNYLLHTKKEVDVWYWVKIQPLMNDGTQRRLA